MAFGDGLRFSVGLDLAQADRQLRAFGARANAIGSGVSSFGASAAKVGAGIAVGFAAAGVALKSVLQSSVDMESFSSRLTTIMGSASGAKARLSELFDYAASTPFNLDQVVTADTTLRGFGADADKLLPKLIDFSAALGTDLTQSAIDFGKAWNQGGVGLESDTGKILKSMIEARAGIKTADMDIQTFRKNMEDVLGEKFAGGAERMSRTFAGMVSNLQDEWSRFTMLINDAGLFNNVKGALSYTLELIGRNREDTAGWARVISEGVWGGIKLVGTGVAAVVDSATALGTAFLEIKAVGYDIAAAFVGVNAAMTEVGNTIAKMAGLDPDASGATRVAKEGRATQASLEGVAASTRQMIADLGDGGTALSETEAFFSAAEKAAKSFGTVAEDAANSGKPKDPAGGGSGGDDAATAASVALAARMDEAMGFAGQMTALNQSESEALRAEYDQRLVDLQAFNKDKLITGQLYRDTERAINKAYFDELARMAEEEAEKERQIQMQSAQSTAQIFGSVASLAGTIRDGMTEDQKDAAMAAFAVQLGAGIAQATINAALAVSEASTLPYPANIVASVAAGAAGVANIAAVASTPPPTFTDTPGPVTFPRDTGPSAMPERTTATFSPGDLVVASRTKEGLRKQVDPYAQRTDGANITVINRRTFGATVRDDVRMNSPLARLSATSPTSLGFR